MFKKIRIVFAILLVLCFLISATGVALCGHWKVVDGKWVYDSRNFPDGTSADPNTPPSIDASTLPDGYMSQNGFVPYSGSSSVSTPTSGSVSNPASSYLSNPASSYLSNPASSYLSNPASSYLSTPDSSYLSNLASEYVSNSPSVSNMYETLSKMNSGTSTNNGNSLIEQLYTSLRNSKVPQ